MEGHLAVKVKTPKHAAWSSRTKAGVVRTAEEDIEAHTNPLRQMKVKSGVKT